MVAFFMMQAIAQTTDTISMGTYYTSDVFYSIQDGSAVTKDRSVWHIAFSAEQMSAAVLANNGAGVEVYLYPGDTTQWSSMDTTGYTGWDILFNSDTTWEEGAFNQMATGHPDYGWGIYNSIDHNVYGYRIYLIKLADQGYKKLWIKRKLSLDGIYEFVYSNLDNSAEQSYSLDVTQYSGVNFVYFNLLDDQVVDYEPSSDAWDIIFTRYWDFSIPYMVTGALTNYGVQVARAYPVADDFVDYASLEFSENMNIIGSDWKEFNMSTFSYDIIDSLAYFVQTTNGNVYKLVFRDFEGGSTGNIVLERTLVYANSINEDLNVEPRIYPNPASSELNIIPNLEGNMLNVKIYNLLGKEVYAKQFSQISNQEIRLSGLQFDPGVYFIVLTSEKAKASYKVVFR